MRGMDQHHSRIGRLDPIGFIVFGTVIVICIVILGRPFFTVVLPRDCTFGVVLRIAHIRVQKIRL
jgi:hypothetical protein